MTVDLSPLWISLKTAFAATVLTFFLGLGMAGWMFSYQGKLKAFIDSVLTLPLVLPPTVVGFLLLILLGRNGPLGQLLKPWGITLIFSWSAAVIAATVVAFPLMYKTVLGAFAQVDQDLIHCARTLGASEGRIFWEVLLPMAWPGVIAGTILSFARALGEFGATLMVAGSIPNQTQTIPIAIFFAADAGKMEEAGIWVLIVVAIALVSITTINYYSHSSNFSQTKLVIYGSWVINQGLSLIQYPAMDRLIARSNPLINLLEKGLILMLTKAKHLVRGFTPLRVTSNAVKGFVQHDIKHFLTFARGLTFFQKTIHKKTIYDSPHLFVTVQKTVANFTLETQLITAGKPLGILGASGSGKSMTLRCIAGLAKPDQGRIILNGRVLFDSEQGINIPPRQRRIGLVFQNYALFPHMKVAQNIAFGLKELSNAERRRRVKTYIELMQLQGLEARYPHELSGGQQQRVALARALAIQPEALLLDEPLSALDNYLRHQIEKLLIEIFSNYNGITLFITHKLEEAYRICEHLIVLSDGKIIASGRKADIFEHPPSYAVAQVTECKNFSSVRRIDSDHIEAVDWGCILRVIEPIPPDLTYVGIRAHHLRFPESGVGENIFSCWLVTQSETQHRLSLYLKLQCPPNHPQDYQVQAEVYKEKWAELKNRPFPWLIQFDPLRLILLEK